jgi:signal transduction histidine kinase
MFLANMSHELRTPLNAIIGYSELLEETAREKGDADTVEDTLKIQSAARHLLHLINEILDLSKVESGKLKVVLEEINVDGFVKEVKNLVDPLITKNNNFLNIVIEPGLELIFTDAIKLKQILFNLLGNAAKFSHGSVIEFMLHTEGAWLVITIADRGIGISQEQLARLFQPFTQADSSTTRKYGGTGLGLAITKQYCELLGGAIAVQSEINKGSTFTVRLPLNASQDKVKAVA